MKPLGQVEWIFLHTVGVPGDTTIDNIRDYHVDTLGWSDVGYHFGIRKDGTVEPGRSPRFAGAHVKGVNSRSIGVCVYGDGDYEPHTPEQREALLDLLHGLMKFYTVPVEGVLGHNEINTLAETGVVDRAYRTSKTCPGLKVDMDEIRERLSTPKGCP